MKFDDVKTIKDLEDIFPPRKNLGDGAEVTRIAPSPTGMPHIGTAMQAVLDRALADKAGGVFILRIEDTDRARTVPGAVEAIISGLNWLETVPDEGPSQGGQYGPYIQSERLSVYQICCDSLIESGGAYRCFCTAERLEQMRALQIKQKMTPMYDRRCRELSAEQVESNIHAKMPFVVRMKIPKEENITVTDLVRGDITFHSSTIDDSVLMKSDGFPTYHLASVVDDHFMRVTTVVRGEEWVPSTPKHVVLYKSFGWKAPRFLHTVLLRDLEKRKLSKRSGDTSLNWFRREGFLNEGFTHFLMRLMWPHPQGLDIYPRSDFVEHMDPSQLASTGPVVDIKLLQFINNHYINSVDSNARTTMLQSYLEFLSDAQLTASTSVEPGVLSEEISLETIKYMLDEIRKDSDYTSRILSIKPGRYERLTDMVIHNLYFYDSTYQPASRESFLKIDKADVLQKIISNFLQKYDNNPEQVEIILNDMIEQMGLTKKQLFMSLRLAITGQDKSPPLDEIIPILGKSRTKHRLSDALALINKEANRTLLPV